MNKETAFIRLLFLRGIGKVTIKKLIDHFGTVQKIYSATPKEIASFGGVNMEAAHKILNVDKISCSKAEDELNRVRKKGYNLYFYGSRDYPKLLSEIYDPPIILYAYGTLNPEDINAVAVVGTRNSTMYGKSIAKLIARKLAANNITVVSGCALGIDGVAHREAIEGRGRTIAVLGGGLERKYPKTHLKLMDQISENGAVISEFKLDEEPLPHNFPLRNRIVSGLSLGVVVVEAPLRSGALITAYQALEQGRDVFAVPGSIFSSKSGGCNKLIKDGAVSVTDMDVVLEEIKPLLNKEFIKIREKKCRKQNFSINARKIFNVLTDEPQHIDRIGMQSKINIIELTSELTELEIMGRIRQVEGKRYIKV